jgi:transcriptional regulator with XRE-family HTH domain
MKHSELNVVIKRFGCKLSRIRESQGMRRQRLSTATDIDILTIINIEHGLTDFSVEYAFILLKAVDLTPLSFLKTLRRWSCATGRIMPRDKSGYRCFRTFYNPFAIRVLPEPSLDGTAFI